MPGQEVFDCAFHAAMPACGLSWVCGRRRLCLGMLCWHVVLACCCVGVLCWHVVLARASWGRQAERLRQPQGCIVITLCSSASSSAVLCVGAPH